MPSTARNVQYVTETIQANLEASTDLKPIQRQTVAYWIAGTHGLRHLQTYPILSIFGPTNTGKNEILDEIERFSRHPQKLVLRNSTEAVLRDFLINTTEGTALLDEADASSSKSDPSSFEGLIKTRFCRSTASLIVNRPTEDGKQWYKSKKSIFGALAAHRQHPFHDPSLDSRVILIDTHPNLNRVYKSRTEKTENPLLGSDLELEAVDLGLPKRLMDSYSPLICLALMIDDAGYVDALATAGEEAESRLRDIQEGEPTILVLAGILAHSISDSGVWKPRTKISELVRWLTEEHALSLTPRQIATIVKSLRLETVKSNGVTVVAPQPLSLVDACERYGYTEDEAYKRLLEFGKSRRRGDSRGAPLRSALGE